jgi:hypothetical protein
MAQDCLGTAPVDMIWTSGTAHRDSFTVAWRTPPRAYGAWETVASNITEVLVDRGWKNVTLFATKDSITKARLVGFIDRGYEEDRTQIGWVSMCLHISKTLACRSRFNHNNFDYLPDFCLSLNQCSRSSMVYPDVLRACRNYRTRTTSDQHSDQDRCPVATAHTGKTQPDRSRIACVMVPPLLIHRTVDRHRGRPAVWPGPAHRRHHPGPAIFRHLHQAPPDRLFHPIHRPRRSGAAR